MKEKFLKSIVCIALLAGQISFAADHTADGCGAFSWDVSRELAALEKPARVVDSGAAPLQLDQHYSVRLAPQSSVKFVSPPERAARSAAPNGGVLRFKVVTPGRYRVAITSRHWIDVISGGAVVASADHEGRAGCALMHKVVAFDLPAAGEAVVQLSGQDDPVVGLVITGPIGP